MPLSTISIPIDASTTEFRKKVNQLFTDFNMMTKKGLKAMIKAELVVPGHPEIEKAVTETRKQFESAMKKTKGITYGKGSSAKTVGDFDIVGLHKAYKYLKDIQNPSATQKKDFEKVSDAMTAFRSMSTTQATANRYINAHTSGKIQDERRRAALEARKKEIEANKADKRFRNEAMAKMAEQRKQEATAQKEQEARQKDALRRQEEYHKRLRQEAQKTSKLNQEWKGYYAANDSEMNRVQKGGSTNPVLGSMRGFYKEQEARAQSEARAAKKQIDAKEKLLAIEKKIAKERTINGMRGGQDLTSIARQISLYDKLARSAKKAGDAKRATYAGNMSKRLNQQYLEIMRMNGGYAQQANVLGRLRSIASRYFSIYSVIRFAQNIAKTTGYFEQQQVALEGILGSATKAQKVLNDIKGFALQSPFQTKELVGFTKQLSAFGLKSDELFPRVKELADISAGLGVDMGRIILAYGQVKAAAVLRGQELRQFTEAGIPMVEELAKRFTALNGTLVTTGEVFKLISQRQVSFEMVADVLSSMTQEGGKFYKMQENITNTLYGQMQKLKDMWTLALEDMGKSGGSMLMGVVKLLQKMVKNVKSLTLALSAAFATTKIVAFVRALSGASGEIARLRALASAKNLINMGIGTAAAAVAFGVSKIVSEMNRLNKKLDEVDTSFAKEIEKTKQGLDSLLDKLQEFEPGTKAYSDALGTLAQNYGDYIGSGMLNRLKQEEEQAKLTAAEFKNLADQIKAAMDNYNEYQKAEQKKGVINQEIGERVASNRRDVKNVFRNVTGTTSEFGGNRIDNLIEDYIGRYGNPDNKKKKKFRLDVTDKMSELWAEAANEFVQGEDLSKEAFNTIFQSKLKKQFGSITDEQLNRFSQIGALHIFGNNPGSLLDNAFEARRMNQADLESTDYWKLNNYFNKVKPGDAYDRILSGEYKGREDGFAYQHNLEGEYLKALRSALNDFSTDRGISLPSELTDALKGEMMTIDGEEKEIIAVDNKKIESVNNLLTSFADTITNPDALNFIKQLHNVFNEKVNVKTDRAAIVADRMEANSKYRFSDDAAVRGIWKRYNPNDNNYADLRNKLPGEEKKLEEEIKSYTKDGVVDEKDKKTVASLEKQLEAVKVLMSNSYFGISAKDKSGGGGGKGGYRQLFTDMFNLIKTAKDQQKKLVEGADGYTQALIDDIGKLENSPLKYFYEGGTGGNPFQQFLDKIQEYGIEGEIFKAKDFEGLRNKFLNGVGVDKIDTADFAQIWKDLIAAGRAKATTLTGKDQKSEKESLLSFLRNMEIQFEKIFGQDEIEDLISKAVKSLTSIERNTANVKTQRGYFDKISSGSNFIAAQKAIYGHLPYETFRETNVAQANLRSLLTSPGGAGISRTNAGQQLQKMLNGGKLDIGNLNGLLAIVTSLQEEAQKQALDATKITDEGERQAAVEAAKQFSGVVDFFIKGIKEATDAILKDFSELEKTYTSSERTSNKILEYAKQNYLDAMDYIREQENKNNLSQANKILAGQNTEENEKERVRLTGERIEITQKLFGEIVKGLGGEGVNDFVNKLFGQNNGTTGISKGGMAAQVLLGDSSLKNLNAMRLANGITAEKDTEEYKKQMEEAAKAAEKFAARLDMASSIISKLDSAIQATAKFANSVIDALEATNGLTKDEYGNYTKENDYSDAKAAIGMISDFSSGMSDSFKMLLSGDIFGAIMNVGSTIANFFTAMFNENDRRIQKQQDKIQSHILAMDKELSQLGFETQWSNGLKSLDDMVAQSEMLNKQAEEYAQLLALEEEKKSGDPEKAEEYEEQQKEKEQEALNLLREMKESIMGTADDLSSTLSDSMIEAFRNGTNAARAWRDSVKTYMQDIIQQMLFDKVFASQIQDAMNEWIYGYKDKYDENGKLVQTAEEQARATYGDNLDEQIQKNLTDEGKSKNFEQKVNEIGDREIDTMNGLSQYMQDLLKFKPNDNRLSGGIESVTEDTARRLEALLNSTLGEQLLTRLNTDTLVASVGGISNQLRAMVGSQKVIETNTKAIMSAIEDFRNNVRPMYVKMT